jgi:stage V sporulation protein K
MIGMDKIKKNILQQLVYYLQGLHDKEYDTLHCLITGSPGTGKTTVARILAKIYAGMGYLSRGTFKVATREMLIGEYIGQTAVKTKKVLESCRGGVLLIDEAYQLSAGNKDKGDSYSKECLDTINQFIYENKDDFVLMLAGYKEETEKCVFGMNQGLERRITWRFNIDDYEGEQLENIFRYQMDNIHWKLENNDTIPLKFFGENKVYFKNNGGDTEILLNKIKISHSFRIINLDTNAKKIITSDDFMAGFNLFKEEENIKKRGENEDKLPPFMYT